MFINIVMINFILIMVYLLAKKMKNYIVNILLIIKSYIK